MSLFKPHAFYYMFLLVLNMTFSYQNGLAFDHSEEYQKQWGLSAIHADYAYRLGFTGKGQTIALIDTPFPSSQRLSNKLAGQIEFASFPDIHNHTVVHSHSQDVASIIVGRKNTSPHLYHGLAFDSKIIAYPVNQFSTAISDGIKRGIKIFNNSWQLPFSATETAYYQSLNPLTEWRNQLESIFYPGRKQLVEEKHIPVQTFKEAVQAGAVLVWGTGNDTADQPSYLSRLPHALPYLKRGWLAVTAIRKDGNIASYANPCKDAHAWCLAAPGGDPTDPLFVASGTNYGTSFATAYVSGAIALVKSKFPNLSEQQIALRLLHSATKEGKYADYQLYGQGLLNLERALSPIGNVYFVQGTYANDGTIFAALKSGIQILGEEFRTIFKPVNDIRIFGFDEFQRAPFALALQDFIHVKKNPFSPLDQIQRQFDQVFHTQQAQYGNIHYHFALSQHNHTLDKLNRFSLVIDTANKNQYGFYMNQDGGEIFGKGHHFPIGIQYAKNPYLSFSQQGTGSFYHTPLGPNSYFKMGFSTGTFDSIQRKNAPYQGKAFYSAQVEMGKQLGDWLFSSQYAVIQNKMGLFHLAGSEGLGLADKTYTEVIHTGLDWLINPHWSWKNHFYYAKSRVKSSGMIQTPTPIFSQAFHSGIQYQDKKQTFGIYLYQPLTITKGHMILQSVTGVQEDGRLEHTHYTIPLHNKRRYQLEAFYHHHLSRNSQFALHANYGKHSANNALYISYMRNF